MHSAQSIFFFSFPSSFPTAWNAHIHHRATRALIFHACTSLGSSRNCSPTETCLPVPCILPVGIYRFPGNVSRASEHHRPIQLPRHLPHDQRPRLPMLSELQPSRGQLFSCNSPCVSVGSWPGKCTLSSALLRGPCLLHLGDHHGAINVKTCPSRLRHGTLGFPSRRVRNQRAHGARSSVIF